VSRRDRHGVKPAQPLPRAAIRRRPVPAGNARNPQTPSLVVELSGDHRSRGSPAALGAADVPGG